MWDANKLAVRLPNMCADAPPRAQLLHSELIHVSQDKEKFKGYC